MGCPQVCASATLQCSFGAAPAVLSYLFHRIGDRLDIDVTQHEIPEDAAEAWIQGWMQMIA